MNGIEKHNAAYSKLWEGKANEGKSLLVCSIAHRQDGALMVMASIDDNEELANILRRMADCLDDKNNSGIIKLR